MAVIKIKWEGNMNFRGYDSENREVLMDAAEIYGGLNNGIRPMQLMLISLGGCTAIEVGNVLNKMRVSYEEFKVEVQGDRADTIPKVFTRIKVKYIIKSGDVTPEKLTRAIKLGGEYCSAANMLKQACPVVYEYELNGTVYKYQEKQESSGTAG
ncbi:MAG: OsmC family protein [Peptococcaceae bacterium]